LPHRRPTDFYKRVIDLRQTVKGKRDDTEGEEKARLDGEQQALKILANATSYGIFIEMIVNDLDSAEVLRGYGVDGHEFPVTSKKYEEPGHYFHPLLATLITGAARLMLALAESRAKAEGLGWVFCDTDSIAMAKPDAMDRDAFLAAARRVCDAFVGLNPYEVATGSILQIEEQNYAPDDKAKAHLRTAPPLYCYAVSAKRYALFNYGEGSEPIIRKASAHGLGHLLPPYLDPDKKRRAKRLKDTKVDLWQEDLWKRIILAADKPEETESGAVIGLDEDTRFRVPVASRYAASKPILLRWFDRCNEGRPYERQVRPFGFLLSLQCQKMEQLAAEDRGAHEWWRKHKRNPAPTAPYDVDPSKAAKKAFDRHNTDAKIPVEWLFTYADALSDYHLQPEPKFFGGDVRRASGQLRRRHIETGVACHIGKETDEWEEQLYVGDEDAALEYGLTPKDRKRCAARIKLALDRFGPTRYAEAAHRRPDTIKVAVTGLPLIADANYVHLVAVADQLWAALDKHTDEERELLEWAFEQVAFYGPYKFAERIGVDGSNLSKALRGKGRKVSADMLDKIRAMREGGAEA
jgi:hypothetical protein